MTIEEEIHWLEIELKQWEDECKSKHPIKDALKMAIKSLEQEPCEDAVSRQAVINAIANTCFWLSADNWTELMKCISSLPSVTPQPKTGKCKDCKWWKDSDGIYRRDVGAESQCPINRREVSEGKGYCYMFETQESEEV